MEQVEQTATVDAASVAPGLSHESVAHGQSPEPAAHTEGEDASADADFLAAYERHVRQHSDALAVHSAAGTLTYRELDVWSDRIAAELYAAVGTGPEPVAILAGSTHTAIAAFVAVTKVARPVIVLDSTTPTARLRGICEIGTPVATLAAPALRDDALAIGAGAGLVLNVPEPDPGADGAEPPFTPVPHTDDTLISIVFTSGSTGRPKGVAIGSRRFTQVALAAMVISESEEQERVLCPVPLSFVFGLGLIVRVLTAGAVLYLHDPRVDGMEDLVRLMREHRITELAGTPYVMRGIAAARRPGEVLDAVRSVMVGGEAVLTQDVTLMRSFTGEDCVVVNQLGSTEGWSVARLILKRSDPLPDTSFLPVGTPGAGREIRLIDENGDEVAAPGASGVIHLVADSMSSGYWRDPDNTARRFTRLEDGRWSYNTGDIGRWNDRGQLEFAGRADNMVKVRGYLVEPAEVEAHLRAEGEVADCVVVGRPSPRGDGTTTLVAYVVPELNAWASGAALRRRLATELPSYMVPAVVVELTELPRNPNGKVDRMRLPEPPAPAAPSAVRKYEYEEAIADVAASALGLEAVGIDDDLFELGLDSLAVEEMVAVLESQLDLQITSATIMQNPTAAQLARLPRGNASNLLDGVMTTLREGTGTPIIAISGAGGLALQLRELALSLDLGRPVYGFQARGLEGGALPDVTVEQMSRRFLQTIRRIQPTGPYTVLGHSLGAVVAYDIARTLVAHGETVAYLGLLDPPDHGTLARSPLLKALTTPTDDDASGLARVRNRVYERYPFALRAFWRKARSGDRFHAWFELGGAAARRYRMRTPLALDEVYTYLADGTPANAADEWFTHPPVSVRVDGDHLSMLRRPYVESLGHVVADHLRSSEEVLR